MNHAGTPGTSCEPLSYVPHPLLEKLKPGNVDSRNNFNMTIVGYSNYTRI